MRAAAVKLSQELFNMIERPEYALVTRLQEGTESQVSIHEIFFFLTKHLHMPPLFNVYAKYRVAESDIT